MRYDPLKHHRQSIRLRGYDYSKSGAYFVTICVQDRICLFGHIQDEAMYLSDAGHMIQTIWQEIPDHYPGIDVDAFVVMPNHIHGIIVLGKVGTGPRACPNSAMTLPDVVQRFKSLTMARYRQGVKSQGWPPFPGKLWQRNYYEHIVRNESDLDRIREYIENNALNWKQDRNFVHDGNQ